MQEGVVGLLRALERYDPELGVPFWAYAAWWVRQAMQQLDPDRARLGRAQFYGRASRRLVANAASCTAPTFPKKTGRLLGPSEPSAANGHLPRRAVVRHFAGPSTVDQQRNAWYGYVADTPVIGRRQ